MNKLLGIMAGLILVSGCAHHRDVRPGANGINRVVIQSEGGEKGKRDAIAQANDFCKEQGKYPGFVDEKEHYGGNLDESTYNNAKSAAKVAEVVGGAATVFGGHNERNLGGVGLLGGVGADAYLGKPYIVEMTFKCL